MGVTALLRHEIVKLQDGKCLDCEQPLGAFLEMHHTECGFQAEATNLNGI